METEEFESLVERAIVALPEEFRSRLENVVVTVRPAPTAKQTRRFGTGLLGLYEGVPLTERGASYSGVMPDKITLFRGNLEAGAVSAADVERRIRHTLMHEIAHHFGMGDEELRKKGLY